MKNRFFGVIAYAIVVVVFLIVLGFFAEKYGHTFRVWLDTRESQKIVDKYQKAVDELEQKRKEDKIGSSTPEGTVGMFIVALKSADLDLASKYYEMALQDKALAGLKDEMQKNGNVNNTISYFEEVMNKGVKKCVDIEKESGGCDFIIRTDLGVKEISLVQNMFTKIWKLTFI